MIKSYLTIAAFSMAIAVILGAMGAHALADVLNSAQLDSFKTGVRYQAWHSLAIFIVMLLPHAYISNRMKSRIAMLFVGGIILFSFSIYLLATRSLLKIDSLASILGPITPMGGLLLISGWILLGIALLKSKGVK